MNPNAEEADDSSLLHAAINALTRVLTSDADNARRLAALEGRTIVIALKQSNKEFALRVFQGQLTLVQIGDPTDAEVRMTGRPGDFLALARASRRGDTIAAGRIEITGDLAIAQQVQNFLLELEVDFEELLSQYVGDVAAHHIGRFVSAGVTKASSAGVKFERDLTDYLHHESRSVVAKYETTEFADSVNQLYDEVERLAARVDRLLHRNGVGS